MTPASDAPLSPLRELGRDWAIALRIVATPISIGLAILAIGLAFAALQLGDPWWLQAVLTSLVGLISGVLGSLWTARWTEFTQRGPLLDRGRGAVRGLRLLLQNLSALERRTQQYKSQYLKPETPDALRIALEEIVEKCNAMQEQTVNAIEDWKGIVPEADAVTQLGVITALKQREEKLTADIAALIAEKEDTDKKKVATIQNLEKRIAKREAELEETKRKLGEKELESATTSLGFSGFKSLFGTLTKTCLMCRNPVEITATKCEKCNSLLFV